MTGRQVFSKISDRPAAYLCRQPGQARHGGVQEGPVAAEAVSGGTEYGASHAGTASAADGSVGTVPALFRHRPGTGAEGSVRG